MKKYFFLFALPLSTLLTEVKNEKSPDQKRYQALTEIAQIMGKDSTPYLKDYAENPHWFLRNAAIKSLSDLGIKDEEAFKKALFDDSLIVRLSALEGIEKLKMSQLSSAIWQMFMKQENYSLIHGVKKRDNILKTAVIVLGRLGEEQSITRLKSMRTNSKYQDLWSSIDLLKL